MFPSVTEERLRSLIALSYQKEVSPNNEESRESPFHHQAIVDILLAEQEQETPVYGTPPDRPPPPRMERPPSPIYHSIREEPPITPPPVERPPSPVYLRPDSAGVRSPVGTVAPMMAAPVAAQRASQIGTGCFWKE